MDALVRTRDKVKLFGIEYNLTEHCNLRCYHCDHASPLMPKKFADLDEYGRDVRALAKAVHVEEFRVVGGEPLLHPQLLDFLRIAHDAGIGDAVKVYTNGVLLHTMPDEFWAGRAKPTSWTPGSSCRSGSSPCGQASIHDCSGGCLAGASWA